MGDESEIKTKKKEKNNNTSTSNPVTHYRFRFLYNIFNIFTCARACASFSCVRSVATSASTSVHLFWASVSLSA